VKVEGIEFETREVEEFQKFLGSVASQVVGRVLNEVMAEAQGTLEHCGAGMESIRQAQGMLAAVRRFDVITASLARVNLEEPEVEYGVDETDDVGGIDVGF